MAEIVKSFTKQAPLTCDICEIPSNVQWYCSNCEASLCSKCKVDHLEGKPLAIFKRHKITARADALMKKSLEEHCPKHHPNLLALHCDNCKELVCTTCVHENHVGHKMANIADAMEKVQQEIIKFYKILETDTLVKCISQDSDATQIIEKYHQWYISLETEVNKRREEVKFVVDECCDRILEEATKERAKHVSATEKKKKQVQTSTKEIKLMLRKCEESLHKQNSQKLQFNKEIPALKQIQVPTIKQVQLPKFLPGKIESQQISTQIGHLQTHMQMMQDTPYNSSGIPLDLLSKMLGSKPMYFGGSNFVYPSQRQKPDY